MQHALQTGADDGSGPAVPRALSRKKKLAVAGVAAIGASAIAITPVAAGPNLVAAQHRDVALTAGYTPNPLVTDSPLDVYGGILGITGENLTGLGESFMANPFPLLSQVAANQLGYADRIGTAFEKIQTNMDGFFAEGTVKPGQAEHDENGYLIKGNRVGAGNGYVYGTNAMIALQKGDIFRAYQEFNALVLYSNTVATTQLGGLIMDTTVTTKWYNAPDGALTTDAVHYEDADGNVVAADTDGAQAVPNTVATLADGTPYTTTSTNRGIPGQLVQNVSNAFSALANKTNIQSGLFYSSFAAFAGVPYEVSRNVAELVQAIQAGEPETAINVLVNSPGMTINALFNGFDYSATDKETCTGGNACVPVVSWPGLFAPLGAPKSDGKTPQHPGGLIYQALTGMGLSVGKAIDNDPETERALFSGLNASSLTSGLNLKSLTPGGNAKVEVAKVEVAKDEVGKDELVTKVDEAGNSKGNDTAVTTLRSTTDTPEAAVSAPERVVDAKKELSDTAAEAKDATDTVTKTVSKSEQRRAKAQERIAKVNDRINTSIKRVTDGVKKATGLTKSTKSESTKSQSTKSESSGSSKDSGGGSSSGGSSGGSSKGGSDS